MPSTLTGFVAILIGSWLCLFNSVHGQYSLNMRLSSNNVQESDNVSIVCEVTNSLNRTVTMAWMKKEPSTAVNGDRKTIGSAPTEQEIAMNARLSERFRTAKRYHVFEETVEKLTKYRFLLNIADVKSSDSGDIGCQIPNNNIGIFKSLVVHVAPKSVRLVARDVDNSHAAVYDDNQQVTFKEGDSRKFFCHVHGTYPEPRVRMLLDVKDITHLFKNTSTIVKNGSNNKELSYNIELASDILDINYDFHLKRLSCIVDHPQRLHAEASSASIFIRLPRYRPKFRCPSEVKVKLYQQYVELRCNVSAEPNVLKATFRWKRHTARNRSIEAGNTDGVYRTSVHSMPGNKTSEMVLRIRRVFPQHFRTYYFEATNDEGITLHGIKLTQDTVGLSNMAAVQHRRLSSAQLMSLVVLKVALVIGRMN